MCKYLLTTYIYFFGAGGIHLKNKSNYCYKNLYKILIEKLFLYKVIQTLVIATSLGRYEAIKCI